MTMINKIEIAKFGMFKDYAWNSNVGGGEENCFKRLNIIYGRNYSGKTTLSRVLRCIEMRKLHENYSDAQFSVMLASNHQISNTDLSAFHDEFSLRVYNSDFVRDNLSWLHNDDGTIRPFTILGAKNIDIDKKIKDVDDKLGNINDKRGLLFDQSEQSKLCESLRRDANAKRQALEQKLKTKAQQIKTETALYNVPTYTITTIRSDIPKSKQRGILNEAEVDKRRKSLRDEPKPGISKVSQTIPNLALLIERANGVLTRKITPNEPILELVNDHLLQEWVRNGIEKHRGKRTECGFCGSVLPADLWNKLDAHFNKESEALRNEMQVVQADLKQCQQDVKEFIKEYNRNSFYNALHESFEGILEVWSKESQLFLENVEVLNQRIQSRMEDIFHELDLKEVQDNTDVLSATISRLNELIDLNNKKTSTLTVDQNEARVELRLSDVAKFLDDIQYDRLADEADLLETKFAKADFEKTRVENDVRRLSEEKKSLEMQMQDESKGASLVNEHLRHFFGHDDLRLVPEGEAPNMKFKITRDNVDAKNLSEGECSLISFCYFIAKIEDELRDDVSIGKLIVYIDDPISSLDSNHIFFMFSLIDSIIAKPKKYGQLFISTHSLDFFKYVKRLTMPDGKDSVGYFLIERRQKKNEPRSFLTRMPSHLREFVTEFNYLFNEIYLVYKAVNGDRRQQLENTYNQFYNLPNNLRKFLECYLFFRFPNNASPLENLPKLFDNNIPALINRVVHEYSHLTYIDRGWMPIDVAEAEECAKIVIEAIKAKDKEQFDSLVASIS